MGLINYIKNEIKAAVGYQQSFEELLDSKDVSRALAMMSDRSELAVKNLEEYNISKHKIQDRKDRAVYDKKGNFLRWSKRHRIAIPYQQFINEIALVFMYGRPVKWLQDTDNTDYAFGKYKDLMKEIRFNAAIRECKRAAGAEGCAAILYHVYRDTENQPRLLLNVLSKSNNDTIYTVKDQYKRQSS